MDLIFYIALGILALMLAYRPLGSNVPWMLFLAGQLVYGYIRPVSNMVFWAGFWLVSVGLYGLYCLVVGHNATKFPPPPGPTPRGVIGNLFDLPPKGVPEYQHWLAEHKDKYGGISSVSVLGTTLVIIHDKNVALDLLEKPVTNKLTSGRAFMRFAFEMVGYENAVVCMPFNDRFKRYRKMMHGELGTRAAAKKFEQGQEESVLQQLVRVYDEPERLIDHYKLGTAATIMKSTYGYNVELPRKGTRAAANDPLVSLMQKMMEYFSLSAVPMKWLVDVIPALRYLPEWCPGAQFKKTARVWRRSYFSAAYVTYRYVQKKMAQGTHEESYVSSLVDQLAQDDGTLAPEDEGAIVWTAAALFGAGSDTTVATLTAFTLAMIRFPGVQEKARAEMDGVIGRDRLPTTADRQNLPYTSAIVKEVLRWWPIAPLGFPHQADENIDYEYNGTPMTIPKGALILPSVWWFLHDPAVYARPDTFDPDRFLPPRNEPEPTDAFGYGRRVCPGRFFADSSLYLNIAQLLSVFTISNAVDADGSYIGVHDNTPTPGVIAYPSDFAFSVKVRDKQAEELLERIKQGAPEVPGNAKDLDDVWESPGLFGENGKGL